MAITTSGGSGTTSSSLASGAGTNLTLFTTPADANYMYTVSVVVAGGCGVGTAEVAAVAPTAAQDGAPNVGTGMGSGAYNNDNGQLDGHGGHGGHQGNPGKRGTTKHLKSFKIVVGPSTAVRCPIFNADSATRTIYVSWNYCGMLFA